MAEIFQCTDKEAQERFRKIDARLKSASTLDEFTNVLQSENLSVNISKEPTKENLWIINKLNDGSILMGAQTKSSWGEFAKYVLIAPDGKSFKSEIYTGQYTHRMPDMWD